MGAVKGRHVLLLVVVTAALFLIAGILIGHFAITDESCPAFSSPSSSSSPPDSEEISRMMIDECDAGNIEETLKQLSSRPHVAGTPAEKENAEMIADQWKNVGLDSVRIIPYDVMLAYPDPENPNKVMITENGEVNFTAALTEEVLRPEDGGDDVLPPFNAYSAQGEPEGPLVYVNYGRTQDFEWLAENRPDINISGCIVIVRYGKIFRGGKALNAQNAGAIGTIIYSDPADYALGGYESGYPNDWWLPDSGAQRGTVKTSDGSGDPITPGYPAKPYMYRMKEEDTGLLKIPVHPISYGDARHLLSELAGDEVEPSWAGTLPITYRYGPGFNNPNRKVKMSIHTSREIRTTYDVIGMINGAVEPDRYVLVGNHRDAWVYGAVDPSSGTAVMMESARVYGEMLKTGWRPRRSVMFCSWGAEEYGLIGSTEFVEEYQKILGERAVAYIDTDGAVWGNYSFVARSTPLLRQALIDATKRVPDGETQERSVYDVWLERIPAGNGLPLVVNLATSSDYATFMYRIAVPSTDLLYVFDLRLGLPTHPVYHSVYENFYYVKTFLDYKFWRHLAMSRVITEFARDLADSVILPFGCVDYATSLGGFVTNLKSQYADKMSQQNITFEYIDSALNNFTTAAEDFEESLGGISDQDAYAVRRVNDQMLQLERAFLDPSGLPGKKWLRHVVFAGGSAFPSVINAMNDIDNDPDQESRWEAVREQMAIVAFTIQSAASTLTDVTQI